MNQAWTSGPGDRACESDHQGVEAPMPEFFTQKDAQHGNKLQTTPRDGVENGEGDASAQGTGEERTQRHQLVPAGEWDAG